MADRASEVMREAAHIYADGGRSVVPIAARGKRPLIPWTRYQLAPADHGQLDAWWDRWPDAGIGLVTGAVSGLLVLDADAGAGGLESLARLDREHPGELRTCTSRTGGGGRHLLYQHPGQRIGGSVRKLADGIDVRADGNLIVAPPSVHLSGRRYEWVMPVAPIRPAPAWLVEALTDSGLSGKSGMPEGSRGALPAFQAMPPLRPGELARRLAPDGYDQADPARRWDGALRAAVKRVGQAVPGTRNRELFAAAYGLARLAAETGGPDDRFADAMTGAGIDAGLGVREIQATVASAFRRAGLTGEVVS